MKKNKKVLTLTLVSLLTLGASFSTAYGHGYIENSRAELARDRVNVNAGPVMYEPQSVEGPGNFPASGPADGHIAGGGKFAELDEQSADRWVKIPMKGGKNTFTWTLTAPHRTDEWKYYITKKGWDPNQPLKRSDLEEISRIEGNGLVPQSTVTHTIDVPTDREGYYIILGVWEIADTTNAFYQVMDVNLSNDGSDNNKPIEDNETPSTPKSLKTTHIGTTTIDLSWNKSTDNTAVHHYDVYRGNKKVATVTDSIYKDTNLEVNTKYNYYVKAVDNSGNTSKASNELTVKTNKAPTVDIEAPSAPSNLHSMGETKNSVDLHWNISTDNVVVKEYNIYRDSILIKTIQGNRYMDNSLDTNTSYAYYVEAIDAAGNVSDKSNTLKVKTTKHEDNNSGHKPDNSKHDTWNKSKTYTNGDKVIFNGVEYTAKWWTRGDTPGVSEVWKADDSVVLEFNSRSTYTAGNRVMYKGNLYEAKWWTRGESPDTSMVWKKVK